MIPTSADIPQCALHKARGLTETKAPVQMLLENFPIVDVVAYGGSLEDKISSFGPNDTVALIAVVMPGYRSYLYRSFYTAFTLTGVLENANPAAVLLINPSVATPVLEALDKIGAFLLFDGTGQYTLCGRSSFWTKSQLWIDDLGNAGKKANGECGLGVVSPALEGERSDILKSAWAHKMLSRFLCAGQTQWLEDFGLHSPLMTGHVLEEIFATLSCKTSILEDSKYYYEDEIGNTVDTIFRYCAPVGDLASPERPGLFRECMAMTDMCRIWANTLAKYKLSLDVDWMAGGENSLVSFCEGLSSFAEIAGIKDMLLALEDGVPVNDIIA